MRIAVVGLGYWGSKVFEEYCDLRDEGRIDEVIACDLEAERLPGSPPADRAVHSLDQILPDVDAVHLCIGNQHHYEVARSVLEADTDILVEKPLAVDREDAYDLVELASSRGRILQTGHIFRFANVVRRVEELFSDGYFGDVQQLSLRWTHQIDPISGTDVLWDLLPHPIDILNFVTGGWPSEVTGMTESYRSPHAETAIVAYRLDDIIGNLQVSWLDPVRRRELEIVGTERSAVVDCVGQEIEFYGDDGTQMAVEANNTIRAEANNFIESIETGKNRYNSAIVGARTVDTIETIAREIT